MKPIDLTEFTFKKDGMLPKKNGGLLSGLNAWRRNAALSKTPIKDCDYRPNGSDQLYQSQSRPEEKNQVYHYGKDNVYQFSDVWRNMGHDACVQEQSRGRDLSGIKKDSVPGTTLNEMPVKTIAKDILNIPINRGGAKYIPVKDNLWKGKFGHSSLFVLRQVYRTAIEID